MLAREMSKIPFARPFLGDEEIAEVADTLRSGWLTTGPKTRRFEEEFARSVGVPHAVGTSGCTGALHIALVGLGVEPGDEVITSTFTFAASGNSIVHSGARPVLVDIDPVTMNLDPAAVEAAITPRTRAVMAVHYAGRPADLGALTALCAARGLLLVEDCAHAIGASVGGRAAGAFGDAGAFSFYANKNLTTGEGGMLTTSRPELAARARVLRLQGITKDAFGRAGAAAPSWRYDVVAAGYKYPMSDINAAIGLHQLRRLPGFQATRARLAARYSERLAGVPGLTPPAPCPAGTVHGWHIYPVRVAQDARRDRDALFGALAARGIECSVHFVPLHMHPYYQEAWGYRAGQFPRAEAAFAEELSLPLYVTMTDAEQDQVIEAIREELAG
jgi:dTDP-4-amino-4,6-dideoxygalactose transaminase